MVPVNHLLNVVVRPIVIQNWILPNACNCAYTKVCIICQNNFLKFTDSWWKNDENT